MNKLQLINIYIILIFLYNRFIAPIMVLFITLIFPSLAGKNIGFLYLLSSFITSAIPIAIYLILDKDVDIPADGIDSKTVIKIILFSLLIQPFMGIISYISTIFDENVANAAFDALGDTSFKIGFVALAVLPALFEELLCRGIIQSAYSKVRPIYMFIIIGLIFGLFHGNLQQFFYAFLLGSIFSALVYYTHSLYAAVLSHFVINGTQFTLGYAQNLLNFNMASGGYTQSINILLASLFVILPTIVAFMCLRSIIRTSEVNSPKTIETEPQNYESPFNVSFFVMLIVGFACAII